MQRAFDAGNLFTNAATPVQTGKVQPRFGSVYKLVAPSEMAEDEFVGLLKKDLTYHSDVSRQVSEHDAPRLKRFLMKYERLNELCCKIQPPLIVVSKESETLMAYALTGKDKGRIEAFALKTARAEKEANTKSSAKMIQAFIKSKWRYFLPAFIASLPIESVKELPLVSRDVSVVASSAAKGA